MSAAPTHRRASMPKNGGPMRQRVSHHGTKPAIVPGARMKNTSDPSDAQRRVIAEDRNFEKGRHNGRSAEWRSLSVISIGARQPSRAEFFFVWGNPEFLIYE